MARHEGRFEAPNVALQCHDMSHEQQDNCDAKEGTDRDGQYACPAHVCDRETQDKCLAVEQPRWAREVSRQDPCRRIFLGDRACVLGMQGTTDACLGGTDLAHTLHTEVVPTLPP